MNLMMKQKRPQAAIGELLIHNSSMVLLTKKALLDKSAKAGDSQKCL
jgi:hypothetical protein